jgi:hypothetical protein
MAGVVRSLVRAAGGRKASEINEAESKKQRRNGRFQRLGAVKRESEAVGLGKAAKDHGRLLPAPPAALRCFK